MNAKRWFYRLLLSYMPVFIIVVSFLFFVFFQTLSEQSRNDAMRTNASLLLQTLRATDASLKAIDQTLVSEVVNSPELAQFFQQTTDDDIPLHMRIMKLMRRMSASYPLIDSIYLVRFQDGKVFSSSKEWSLEQYLDQEFIAKHRNLKSTDYPWIGARPFKEFDFQEPKRVISLVRSVPNSGGSGGMIVVNVAAASVTSMVKDWYGTELNNIRVMDGEANDLLFDDTDNPAGKSFKVVSNYMSPYTGWVYESGFRQDKAVLSADRWFNVWIIGGMALLLAAVAWIVYVTHRHYQPIAKLVNRVNEIAETPASKRSDTVRWDEFAVIESALDRMFAERDQSVEQGKKDAVFLRNYTFRQWLDGTYEDHPLGTAQHIDVPLASDRPCLAAVLEIDNYAAFVETYSKRDRFLLQYAAKSACQETAAQHGWSLWADWLTGERLAMLWQPPEQCDGEPVAPAEAERRLAAIVEDMLAWINGYLKWTATAGIGGTALSIRAIPHALDQALRALNRKMTCSSNQVLIEEELRRDPPDLQPLARALAHSLTGTVADREARLSEWVELLRAGCLTREEVRRACRQWVPEVARRLKSAAEEAPEAAWLERLDACLTLEELEWTLRDGLEQAAERLACADQERNALLIGRVQAYMREHYADPQMSLNLLSETFDIAPKLLSKSFKEVTGEKFIDVLIGLRLEEAKRLLRQTDLPVQTIAVQIGYGGAVSFSRVFKRMEGISPGEYRSSYSAAASADVASD
ncbi:helix-turn-helix domain-containing protein [Paenibacillus dendritiformis]|uniref:helix-turn-helix domain-containing protein n=1 Tax=Paenibacillus dendritiformis TaxID=130049 RepID=UPI00387E0A7F